ncbi:hypothetical protein [Bacillus cereus]
MIIDTNNERKVPPFVKQLSQAEILRLNVNPESGWKLDWTKEPFYNDCQVYGLFTTPLSNQVEGLVAFRPEIGSLEMFQLESARHNRYLSSNRMYKGIGKSLVAFGCQLSKGNSQTRGFLRAYAKANAKDFYLAINALEVECDLWVIDPIVGEQLIEEYLLGGRG